MAEKRLGRGLDSLITRTTEGRQKQVFDVPLDQVVPNPNQPRQVMNAAALEGLASSIRHHGVLQPIVVQRVTGGYQLVAGERRVRASRLAEQSTVPALIIEADGVKSLELALIENIQREQLGPLEEAAAFEALISESGMTHAQLAERVGKSRAAVTNALRLLELPDGAKRLVLGSQLSAGQARAILGARDHDQIEELAAQAARNHWSVREVERRVKEVRVKQAASPKREPERAQFSRYEEELRSLFGTKVSFVDKGGRGELRFAFYSSTDRDRLIHLLLTGGRRAGDQEVVGDATG